MESSSTPVRRSPSPHTALRRRRRARSGTVGGQRTVPHSSAALVLCRRRRRLLRVAAELVGGVSGWTPASTAEKRRILAPPQRCRVEAGAANRTASASFDAGAPRAPRCGDVGAGAPADGRQQCVVAQPRAASSKRERRTWSPSARRTQRGAQHRRGDSGPFGQRKRVHPRRTALQAYWFLGPVIFASRRCRSKTRHHRCRCRTTDHSAARADRSIASGGNPPAAAAPVPAAGVAAVTEVRFCYQVVVEQSWRKL